jgi:cation transport regulator
MEEMEMPFKNNSDLPDRVRDNLPEHAQDIYREAYNNAWKQYDEPEEREGDRSREETSHAVAWSAVKNKYEKNESTGKWKLKEGESEHHREKE